MADLVITAANVLPGTNATKTLGVAGVAITAGQVVYLDSATNTFKLADCNSGTAAARVPFGVALDNAAANQPITVQTTGPCAIGAAVTPGVGYYLSANPGGVCPVADLVAGCYPSWLGFATSATQITLGLQSSGVSL